MQSEREGNTGKIELSSSFLSGGFAPGACIVARTLQSIEMLLGPALESQGLEKMAQLLVGLLHQSLAFERFLEMSYGSFRAF
tara:strand:- start:137 stop:382 length:246 start_codon:yes stop_codon:yes gene_type:complete